MQKKKKVVNSCTIEWNSFSSLLIKMVYQKWKVKKGIHFLEPLEFYDIGEMLTTAMLLVGLNIVNGRGCTEIRF